MLKKARIVLIIIFIFLPIVLIFLLSFFNQYRYPSLLPSEFSIRNWSDVLADSFVLSSIVQGVVVALGTALFATFCGFLVARAITTSSLGLAKILRKIYSLPLFIPAIALFIGVHQVSIYLSFANTVIGVIFAHSLISIPYCTNICLSYFEGIGVDMEGVARLLGCSNRLLWFRLLIPLMKPAIVLSLSMGFLLSFSEYFATAIIGGGKVVTLSGVLYPLISNGNLQKSSALSVEFVLINLLVFGLADIFVKKRGQKYLYG